MCRANPGPRRVVLVVDDEPLTRLTAIDIVEAAGFEAIGASNADEAVRVLEERADIRAVFTDFQMPGSMNGLELIRVMKERWPCVASLIASGRTNIGPADLPNGVQFIAKPYLSIQIETALRQLID